MKNVVIIGAGGLGREIAAMMIRHYSEQYNLLGFVDDGKTPHDTVNGAYVLGGLDWLASQGQIAVVIALGKPAVRKAVYEKIKHLPLEFPNIIHPQARLHYPQFIEMGQGNIICDSAILTVNVSLGHFNLINLQATLGHDMVLHNYNTLMPAVHISGGAEIHSEAFIGTGANLIKATKVGSKAVVSAGAVVQNDIPTGETWAGVPAKPLIMES